MNLLINKDKNEKLKQLIYPMIILLLTIVAYSNSFENGLIKIWDDGFSISLNPYIKDLSWHGIKKIFTVYYFSNYIPLTTLSWALDYHFFKLDPTAYHIHNLILHLVNILLVYKFVQLLSRNYNIATIVALFFAIHPMHVESVAWISERKDLLYSVFYLSAIIFYVKYKTSKYLPLVNSYQFLVLTFVFFLLSLLSKSMAVTLPAVLLLIDYYYDKNFSLKLILEKIPFILLTIVFIVITFRAQFSIEMDPEVHSAYSIFNKICLISYGLFHYILFLFVPFKLSAIHYYPTLQSGMLPVQYYFALVIIVFLFVLLFKFRNNPYILFGSLFFLITISPVIQLVPIGMAIVAERYTYLPYIGLLLILFPLLKFCFESTNSKIYLGIIIIYAVVFSFITYERTTVWKNNETLFADVAEKYPSNYYAWLYLGKEQFEKGNYEGAIKTLTNVFTKKVPNDEMALGYFYSGRSKSFLQDYNSAIIDYKKSIAYNPIGEEAYNQCGIAKRVMNDYSSAIEYYNLAIAVDPKYADVYNNRATAKALLKNYIGAIEDFNNCIALSPNYLVYFNRGYAKQMIKDYNGAIKDYNASLDYSPSNPQVIFFRAQSEAMLNNLTAACEDWNFCLRQNYAPAQKLIEKYCINN